jgi:Leucine-rich repeat (LRR) protein
LIDNPELKVLDLSQNAVSQIDDLSYCANLETLNVNRNELSTVKSIKNVVLIPKLRALDLSSNKLGGEYAGFLELLSQCSHLKDLSLKGNPITKTMPHYRRMVVSKCPGLKSLDGKAICKEERRRCNAWGAVVANGGTFDDANEADRAELNKILTEISKKNASKRATSNHRISREAPSSATPWQGQMSLDAGLSKAIGEGIATAAKKAFEYIQRRSLR